VVRVDLGSRIWMWNWVRESQHSS